MSQAPVIEGEFPTGPELMLWRPGLNLRRLRWRVTLRSLLRTIAAAATLGIELALLTTHGISGTFAWLMTIFTIVITGVSAMVTVVDYRCAEYDHRHPQSRPCRLEATPGEFFYRTGDFRDLSPSTTDSVRKVVVAVARVHSSPAAGWIDPQQLRDVHHVAWDALYLLDRTRALRAVLTDPRCAEFEEIPLVRSYVINVDEAVDRVLTCLLQAELLMTGWERKLAETDRRAQLRTELSGIPPETISATVQSAEAIPEGMFAYLTAARDLTSAGPFDWERPFHGPETCQGIQTRHPLGNKVQS